MTLLIDREPATLANDVTEPADRPALNDALGDLERMIGLTSPKSRLRSVLEDLERMRARKAVGAVTAFTPIHMLFTGNSGTGKTTFAEKTADLLHRLGHIETNRFTVAASSELMGQYEGHSTARTMELIKRARGGVLFIDDAYLLNRPDAEIDYGREAIDVLTEAMQIRTRNLVVILAGDAARMNALFDDAPRLRSCIAHHIHFPDYTQQELLDIAEHMLDTMHFQLDPAARAAFAEYLARRIRQPHFANARSVRNALDRARLRQANRLFALSLAGQSLDPAALGRIVDTDLPAQSPAIQLLTAGAPDRGERQSR